MSKNSLLKFVVAFGLLAVVLTFLGVHFVPRIQASSSGEANIVIAGKQTRLDYIDERYPRAIVVAEKQTRLDYIDERYPRAIVVAGKQTRPDYVDERYPRAIVVP